MDILWLDPTCIPHFIMHGFVVHAWPTYESGCDNVLGSSWKPWSTYKLIKYGGNFCCGPQVPAYFVVDKSVSTTLRNRHIVSSSYCACLYYSA